MDESLIRLCEPAWFTTRYVSITMRCSDNRTVIPGAAYTLPPKRCTYTVLRYCTAVCTTPIINHDIASAVRTDTRANRCS